MPGLSGGELARTVLARRPGLPVILMSGHVGPGPEQRARQAGVSRLLHKPLAIRELADALAQSLAPWQVVQPRASATRAELPLNSVPVAEVRDVTMR